jgi:hypothetical protein
VTKQSGAKDQFYSNVNNMSLNTNCEAQREYKNLKNKMWKIGLEVKINAWVI